MGLLDNRVHHILFRLATHGWIPLRSMSALLGYSHATGVYQRQKGKNPISTILIGGTYRVYADEVIKTLESVPEKDQEASTTILKIYRRLEREQEKEHE